MGKVHIFFFLKCSYTNKDLLSYSHQPYSFASALTNNNSYQGGNSHTGVGCVVRMDVVYVTYRNMD